MAAPLGFEPRLDTLEPCGTIRYAREPYGASTGSRTLSTCLEGRYAAKNTLLAYGAPYPIRTDDLLITSELL